MIRTRLATIWHAPRSPAILHIVRNMNITALGNGAALHYLFWIKIAIVRTVLIFVIIDFDEIVNARSIPKIVNEDTIP